MELFKQFEKGNHGLLNGEAGPNANARSLAKRHVGISSYKFGICKTLLIKGVWAIPENMVSTQGIDWYDHGVAFAHFAPVKKIVSGAIVVGDTEAAGG